MADKFIRVADTSPLRCKGVTSIGQCNYQVVEGTQFCLMHGSGNQHLANKRKVHEYRLQQWRERHDNFASSDTLKNLSGEIGITRLVLESIMTQLKSANELLLYSDKIAALVSQISKLTYTFQQIQEKNRDLLDKTIVFNIADAIVNILSEHITDPDELNLISEKLNGTITRLVSGEIETGTSEEGNN